MSVEDALSRRTRALMLDAKAAIEAAPLVTDMMAKEMGNGEEWIKDQIHNFNVIAKNYLPNY
jgi:glycerol-3-phosphate dehydrogenase